MGEDDRIADAMRKVGAGHEPPDGWQERIWNRILERDADRAAATQHAMLLEAEEEYRAERRRRIAIFIGLLAVATVVGVLIGALAARVL